MKIRFKGPFYIFCVCLFIALFTCIETRIRALDNSSAGTKPARKQWTVMIFMAADNNLEEGTFSDLNELEMVGSTDAVNFVVQVDRSGKYYKNPSCTPGAKRFYITKDKDPHQVTSPLLEELGEVDTAARETLVDFVTWAKSRFPAEKYALILWNHGTGWKEIQPSALYNMDMIPAFPETAKSFHPKASKEFKEAFELVSRNISYDDTSGTSMDIPTLHNTLSDLKQILGVPLELLGYDACLMQMAEVAHAGAQFARYQVGSTDLEPEGGWAYDLIARKLASNPGMSGREFGEAIISSYINSYSGGSHGNSAVALSLVDLTKASDFVEKLNAFCTAIENNIIEIDIIEKAREESIKFVYKDYVDLGSFLNIIASKTRNNEVRTSAYALLAAITGKGSQGGFVVRNAFNHEKYRNSCGLSIFFPDRSGFHIYKNRYKTLTMSRKTQWYDFLCELEKPNLPYLKIEDIALEDENKDGRIAAGEKVKVRLIIRNHGKKEANTANATIRINGKLTEGSDQTTVLTKLPAPGKALNMEAFEFQVKPEAEINSAITMDVSISGSEIPVSTMRTTFFIKAPFTTQSHVLLIFSDAFSPAIPVLQAMFMETKTAFDTWDRTLDGNIKPEVLKRYLDGWVFLSIQDSSDAQQLTHSEIKALDTFLRAGGRLTISGQDAAFSLRDSQFLKDLCRVSFVQDDINVHVISECRPFSHTKTSYPIYGGDGANNQKWPDEIDPLTGAIPILTYIEGSKDKADKTCMAGPNLKPGSLTRGKKSTGTAAVQVTNGYRLMFFAFGIEAINSSQHRLRVMEKIREYMVPELRAQIDDYAGASVARSRDLADTPQEHLERVDLLSNLENRILNDLKSRIYDEENNAEAILNSFENMNPENRQAIKSLEKIYVLYWNLNVNMVR